MASSPACAVPPISRSDASIFALTQYGCEKASLLGIPYTFRSEDHFWNFAASDLAQEFLIEPHEIGLPMRGLCYGEEGFRHFFFKNEVKGLEDLKNLKIRVSSDPIMTGMVSNLGASATTASFTELYSALSTGVVDGAEQPAANYRSNAFQEVAPYLLLDGHTLGALQIVIADYSWNKLNGQQQAWVLEAAQYTSEVCREKVAEIEANTFELLHQVGACLTLLHVPAKAAALITSVSSNRFVVILLLNLILLVLGMIMDMAPIILIATPILLPVAVSGACIRCSSAS